MRQIAASDRQSEAASLLPSGERRRDVRLAAGVERLLFLVGLRRDSAEVKVGDEEDAEEENQTHEQRETVGEHALRRKVRVLRPTVDTTTQTLSYIFYAMS